MNFRHSPSLLFTASADVIVSLEKASFLQFSVKSSHVKFQIVRQPACFAVRNAHVSLKYCTIWLARLSFLFGFVWRCRISFLWGINKNFVIINAWINLYYNICTRYFTGINYCPQHNRILVFLTLENRFINRLCIPNIYWKMQLYSHFYWRIVLYKCYCLFYMLWLL